MAEGRFFELENFLILDDSKESGDERYESPNKKRENPASDTFKWTAEQTYFLLEQYEMQIGNVGPMKPFRKKKNMWKHLCEQCSAEFGKQLTIDQVEGRFKTIVKVAKNRLTHNRIRKDIPYSDILNNILHRNMPKTSKSFTPLNDVPRKKREKSLQEDMIDKLIADKQERHKEKLEARAKRHAEKMDLLTKILAAKTSSSDSRPD